MGPASAKRAVLLGGLFAIAACPAAEPIPAPLPAPRSATEVVAADGHEVRILYDRHRIPHVQAETDRGVFFGLGYQQARDFPVATLASLWSATGRFAHVAGASVLGRDEHILTFGIDQQARAQASDPERLDARVRSFLEAYAAGVEAGRHWWLEHPEAIEDLAGEGGATMHFDPVPAWLDPYFERGDLAPRLARLFSAEITLFHVLSLGAAMNGGAEFIGAGYALTNVWSVRNGGDDASTSMTVDSHQPIKRGGARAYLVQMSGDEYDVAGYTMPGYPCIVLGFGRQLAFSNTSLPQAPRRIMEVGGVPFRFHGAAPVVSAAWEAQLEPDAPARIRVGETVVPLLERTVALEYWDVERGQLVPHARSPLTFHRVPETEGELAALGLSHPVLDPPPGAPIDPARTGRVRFEGRSFLAARNPMEFWIRVGLASHVGPGAGGLHEVLEQALLCFGRGQAFQAVDAQGGMEFVWSSLVPVPGPAALEQAAWRAHTPVLLDGNDPAFRWQGFHRFDELPRLLDRGHGERAEVWINANDSPHVMRAAGGEAGAFGEWGPGRDHVMEPRAWKSLRHDRARELLDRAAADGRVTSEELERAALDVQDPWSRRMWPLIGALAGDPELGSEVRGLLAWIEELRFEDARGRPGSEAFLAHPMSQVTVFTSLLHHGYEARLLALEDLHEHETTLGLDPLTPLPTPEAFAREKAWERCRGAMRSALEDVARLHAASLRGGPGRLTTREVLAPLVGGLAADGPWSEPEWRALLDDAPLEVWGSDAARVPARWGQVHLYALTPHARRTFPATLLDRALASILDPGGVAGASYHGAMRPLVFPAGGTGDTIFQLHAEGFRSTPEALFAHGDGKLLLLPIDFGSQLLWSVELRAEEPPRARFLASLGSTEITRDLEPNGTRAGDHARTVGDFAAGRWADFATEPALVERGAERILTLILNERGELDGLRESAPGAGPSRDR